MLLCQSSVTRLSRKSKRLVRNFLYRWNDPILSAGVFVAQSTNLFDLLPLIFFKKLISLSNNLIYTICLFWCTSRLPCVHYYRERIRWCFKSWFLLASSDRTVIWETTHPTNFSNAWSFYPWPVLWESSLRSSFSIESLRSGMNFLKCSAQFCVEPKTLWGFLWIA